MIKTNNVKFSYKKKIILDDVTFEANTGEITYLAGVNGTGKTTWVKCATELLTINSGTILFDKQSFQNIRDDFAICFDTPPLYKHLSCEDKLAVLYGIDNKVMERKELLNAIGISDYMQKNSAKKLSYGQSHRLGIAGAILRKPKYLILDEPDLGLDPIAWEVVQNEILKLKERGSTIIITGQNFMQLEDLVDHVCMLSKNKIIANMSVNNFLDKYCNNARSLKNAFLNAEGAQNEN